MHLVVNPLPIVFPTILPEVHTLTMDVIIPKLAIVLGAICPREVPAAILHSFAVLAHILGAIWPQLKSLTVQQVILPLPLVLGAVYVDIRAKTMCLVLMPTSLEDVAIGMLEPPMPMRFIFKPLTFVLGTVWPLLRAKTVAQLPDPFTGVLCTIVERVRCTVLSGALLVADISADEGAIALLIIIVQAAGPMWAKAASHCAGGNRPPLPPPRQPWVAGGRMPVGF
mmetsp:Transcript_151586/g.267540  ORF Transcript_151586/g.267540 Transcript_151586/m.267540 type:complete len:225 (+) Transcript_151586:281-955(+)